MTRRRLRIALVGLTAPFRGGIAHHTTSWRPRRARHTTLLCRALRERHEVDFFALNRQYPELLFPGSTQRDPSRDRLETDHEAIIDSLNPITWLTTAHRIRKLRPDLVLIAWWHPALAPAFGSIARLARLAGLPVCFLCHNAVPHDPGPADAALSRYALSVASAFLTHSRADADALQRRHPDIPTFTHPHPVYADLVPDQIPTGEEARAALQLEGKKVVLFFGFVRAYKGLSFLLRAFHELNPALGAHLLLVGEFYQDKAEYQADLDALTARGQLTLVDRYVPNEDVPRYFTAADLVAVPYLDASQSGIVQLAYAFSRPVVASRVGGLPEVVRPGETGLLVPPGDAGELAAAIREALQPERAAALRSGIAAMQARCSWTGLVDTVEAVAAAV